MYDVAIIGAGVVGGMIARALSKYHLKICILEKENDVAMGATRANSAIVHAGFDAKPGTLKAKLNVEGAKMMEKIAEDLGVKYQNNGSMVIGFSDEDKKTLEALLKRGEENGVEGLRLLAKEEVAKMEPGLSENVTFALYAPTGAIICPYELTIAAIGNAMDNGAELKTNFKVLSIKSLAEGFAVLAENEAVEAKFVINAAGVYGDAIAKMIGDTSFAITPRKGEYILLDKACGNLVKSTIFRTPSEKGKGILVSPTVDGNLILGPTAEDSEDKENKETTSIGLSKVLKEAEENVKELPVGKAITSFSGLRAVGGTGDFIINAPRAGFINVAAIESPGLSASPAIAEVVLDLLETQGIILREKEAYNPKRQNMHFFREASTEEKNKIIKEDKAFGKVVCRCEGVTEGEIIKAIRTNPRPRDLDGIKRRTRAQMGRCQGGFCMPYIIKLLAEEMGVPEDAVTKCGGASKVITGKTKEDM